MYSIGQIEKITGVKPHVLRYWEEQIPSFSPKKTIGGRRTYSQRDLELIQRLRHLIYDKKYTIDGARRQIVLEAGGDAMNSQTVTEIRMIKDELTRLYFSLKEARQKNKD